MLLVYLESGNDLINQKERHNNEARLISVDSKVDFFSSRQEGDGPLVLEHCDSLLETRTN